MYGLPVESGADNGTAGSLAIVGLYFRDALCGLFGACDVAAMAE
jgi:hypothetical protein